MQTPQEIAQWLHSIDYHLREYDYTIRYDKNTRQHIVDMNTHIHIRLKTLTELPVQFGEVKGNFNISSNKLTTLKGCPHTVSMEFECSGNELTTLEGGPTTVGGNYICEYNKLTSLKGAPEKVGGIFDCEHNQLKTLEFGPHETGKGYHCGHNQLTSLNHVAQKMGNGLGCMVNQLTSLDGCPHTLSNLWIRDNPIVSLRGTPKIIGDFHIDSTYFDLWQDNFETLDLTCETIECSHIDMIDSLKKYYEPVGGKTIKRFYLTIGQKELEQYFFEQKLQHSMPSHNMKNTRRKI